MNLSETAMKNDLYTIIIRDLAEQGLTIGMRLKHVKPEFPGKFMVAALDEQDGSFDPDNYAIVGDDLVALVIEANAYYCEMISGWSQYE